MSFSTLLLRCYSHVWALRIIFDPCSSTSSWVGTMRKWCFALAVVSAVGVSAPVVAQAQTVYVGVHAGNAWSDTGWDSVSLTGTAHDFSDSGLIAGGQI